MNDPESKRRGPVRYALAVVVVLTASGIVLREWGPINPAISVITQVGTPAEHDAGLDQQFGPGGFGGTSLTIGPDRTLHVWLSMTNQSHSTVRVVGARVRSEDGDGAPGLLLVRVSGVPRSIDRNEAAYVDVVINFTRACANAPGSAHRFTVVGDVRTTSGRIKTVGGNVVVDARCPPS